MIPRGQRTFQRFREASSASDEKDAGDVEMTEKALSPPRDAAQLSDRQLEVALYIESISSELRIMAKTAELEALSYFLEMARIEASIQIERRALPADR